MKNMYSGELTTTLSDDCIRAINDIYPIFKTRPFLYRELSYHEINIGPKVLAKLKNRNMAQGDGVPNSSLTIWRLRKEAVKYVET